MTVSSVSELDDLVSTVLSLITDDDDDDDTTCSAVINRSIPQSVAKNSTTSNVFTTSNFTSSVTNVDNTDTSTSVDDDDDDDVSTLSSSTGVTVTDQTSYELAQSTNVATVVAQTATTTDVDSITTADDDDTDDTSSTVESVFDKVTSGNIDYDDVSSTVAATDTQVTDSDGNSVSGIPSDVTYGVVSDQISLINAVDDSSTLSASNYSNNNTLQNLYNVALQSVLTSGTSAFLSQLLAVDKYAASNETTVKNYASTAASNGDLGTLSVIVDTYGYQNIPNMLLNLRAMKNAMTYSEDNITNFKALLTTCNVEAIELYTTLSKIDDDSYFSEKTVLTTDEFNNTDVDSALLSPYEVEAIAAIPFTN